MPVMAYRDRLPQDKTIPFLGIEALEHLLG